MDCFFLHIDSSASSKVRAVWDTLLHLYKQMSMRDCVRLAVGLDRLRGCQSRCVLLCKTSRGRFRRVQNPLDGSLAVYAEKTT